MSKCKIEVLQGYIQSNVNARVNVVLNVAHNRHYNVMTIYNRSDKTVKVEYRTESGQDVFCYVPAAHVFTRIVNGSILVTSLFVTSVGGASTGDIIFNLGNS